jgi:hypothetical protein
LYLLNHSKTKSLKMKKQFLAFAPALLMAAVFTMSSCEKEEDKTYANVLVAHASPDAPGVDYAGR